MTDQCKHCTMRGDYKACSGTPCGHHENWINKQRIKRMRKMETALLEITKLSATRQDEGCNIAYTVLNELSL